MLLEYCTKWQNQNVDGKKRYMTDGLIQCIITIYGTDLFQRGTVMVKAIIFDLDGLLIDTEIVSYKIYKELLQKFGYDFLVEEYTRTYSGKTEIKNVMTLIENYRLPWTVEQGLFQVLSVEERMINEGIDLKKGAKELLSYLKENNYKTAIATSSTCDRAMNILNQHDFAKYFDSFVFAEELTNGKPNPEVFLKACDKIGEEPKNCLVLEDSEAGIQAAYSANIPVICIPDMKMPAQEYLDKTIAVLESLD